MPIYIQSKRLVVENIDHISMTIFTTKCMISKIKGIERFLNSLTLRCRELLSSANDQR